MTLTLARLRELLHYDPETGAFTWKNRRGGGARMNGRRAGHQNPRGYIVIRIDGKDYLGHRLAWFYVHGEWPEDDLDHKNRATGNNRMDELRPANASLNAANRKRSSRNTSGLKGVHKRASRWIAQINKDGQYYYLGLFDDRETAHQAYVAKARELFGEFARAS